MMRRAGRIEPGSGDAVFTGQSGLSNPARIAFTKARLSFFVRPLTEGTVIGGSFAAESFAMVEAVVKAVLDDAGATTGVDDAAVTPWAEAVGTVPSGGSPSPGAGPASLLAAQAREARRATERNTVIDEYLLNKV